LEMDTYYRPSQWRGKCLIYRSTDPDEPKREKARTTAFLAAVIFFFATFFLLSR